MSVSVASTSRRRRYCIDCGRISRPCPDCNDEPTPDPDADPREQLSRVAGMPPTKSYPPTAVNLRRAASELEQSAIVKDANGDPEGAEVCRQLAELNRREAEAIENKP